MKYKVVYPLIPNAGDLLNVAICEQLFHIEVKQSKSLSADLSAIGSGLGGLQYSDQFLKRAVQGIVSPFMGKIHIWGTGFIREKKEQERKFYRKGMRFHAVRGELSKRRAEELTGKKLDIPTGDGGLLTPFLYERPIQKKYKIGIIPHFKEQQEPEFQKLVNSYEHSTVINLREEPLDVFRKLAECEYILSSSLHGLIIADAFGIPNHHIYVTGKMSGDGFKYRDYYSSYGLEVVPWKLKECKTPTINQIIDAYQVPAEQVKQKQKQLMDAFPFKSR